MRGFREIISGLLATVVACLVLLAGCGGSGALGGSSAAPEDYVKIEMKINADLSVESATGVEEVGDVGTGKFTDFADVSCEIVFDPAGSGSTPGGITILQAGQTYPDDCPTPPGPSKCIQCINEYKISDDGGVTWYDDPTLSHCSGTCSGMVPEGLLGVDTIPIRFAFHAGIDTTTINAGTAMIRADGTVTDADFLASDLADIHLNTSDDYVITGCDGNPDPPEITMTLTEPVPGAFDAYSNPGTGTITWTKGFTISDMGQPDPQSGFNTCDFSTFLDGDLPVSTDQESGAIQYAVKFCSDMQSCPAFGAGGFLDTGPMEFFDGLDLQLEGNLDSMLTPDLWLSFAIGIQDTSLYEETVVIESPDLGHGLSQPTYSFASIGRSDSDDGILNDDYLLTFVDAYKYQLHDFVMMIWDIVSWGNEVLAYPMLIEFSSGCAISDEFAKNSQACYLAGNSIPNEPFTPTLGDWQAIDAAQALSFSTTNADALKYVDLYKTAGQIQSFRIGKYVLPSTDWELETRMLNVAGIDDQDGGGAGNSDFIRFGLLNNTYSGYVIGVEAIDDGNGPVASCFAVRYLNGVVQEGAYVSCDRRDDISLHFTHAAGTLRAEVSFDGGQSWTDIELAGTMYPGAAGGTQYMTYVSQIGDHGAIIEGFSADHATAKDNYLSIENIRWKGLYNSNLAPVEQYADVPYGQ